MGWKSFDFECGTCAEVFADLVSDAQPQPEACPSCGATTGFARRMSAPAVMSTIVPSYPGSKRVKAGYQHTHNRPAEKKGSQISMYGSDKNGS